MKITTHDTSGSPGLVRFGAETGNERFDLEFRSDDVDLVPSPEAAVASLLLLAMSRGEDIEIDRPLDPRFVMNLDSVQDIYTCWSPLMKRTEVHAPTAERRRDSGGLAGDRATASFCSGGVDSLYTLVKQMDRIDRLVFVHGFDIPLSDEESRRQASTRLKRLAAICGKQLIEVETNLRDVVHLDRPSSRFGAWDFSHGSALAGVAHVLSGMIDRIYVPSTISYPRLRTWGSHPVLDPLWSSHDIDLIHDGCEARRFDKCAVIAQHPEMVKHIRVCWRAENGVYNCGECEKCVRTMVALAALGALNGDGPFETELTPRLIRSIDIKHRRHEKYIVHSVPDLRRRNPRLARSALYTVATSRVRRLARSARNRLIHFRK